MSTPPRFLKIFLVWVVVFFTPTFFILAADIGTLHSVRHGGFLIFEGEIVTRDDLRNVHNGWEFNFSWPNPVTQSTRSFLGIFHGTFGNLDGGAAIETVNFGANTHAWFLPGDFSFFKGINLPALGELDTTSATYTAMVAEVVLGTTRQETADWFASGGTDGVEPVNYTTLTFFYDGSFTPDNLDLIHSLTHGGKEILDGDLIFRSDVSVETQSWTFNFDWPRAVQNLAALFTVFRGTFGNLEGGEPTEGVNYGRNFQAWNINNPKNITKFIDLPSLGGLNAQGGTYTAMVAERDIKYLDSGLGFSDFDQINWFASGGEQGIPPFAYSLLEFEYSPLDPLILQYEPILYLHPDENYQPMNIEAFVESSSLWDDHGLLPDELLKIESIANPVTIDDIGVPESDGWYLSFSGGLEPKTFDVGLAKSKYDQLIASGKAAPTYYVYKADDSFIDDEGVLHEFIVLQYWYFYAFNDWLEHGGFNNHEGDWETVMIFLDKNTEEPKYVAYSAHLNDGEPGLNPFQDQSVRRSWNSNEVVKEAGQVVSFVSLGSHANYPNNGNEGVHINSTVNDHTSIIGKHVEDSDWVFREAISASNPSWMIYEGKWGADVVGNGAQGPQGPNLIAPILGGGVARFHSPIKWAGIDKIGRKTVTIPTKILNFIKQLTTLSFSEDLQEGTEVVVDVHDENISFGENLDVMILLPHFWDITSNIENETFGATVTFQFDEVEVTQLEVDESDLAIFLYNDEVNFWERVVSSVDTVANTISFFTSHFSRYAIGVEKVELDSQGKLQALYDYVQNSSIRQGIREYLLTNVRLAMYFIDDDKLFVAEIILSNMEKHIELKREKGISEEDTEMLLEMLQDIEVSI